MYEAPILTAVAAVVFEPDFGASGPEMDTGPAATSPSPGATPATGVATPVASSADELFADVASVTSVQPEAGTPAEAGTPVEVATPVEVTPAQEAPAAAAETTPATEAIVDVTVFIPAMSLPSGYSVYVSTIGCTPDGTCPYGQVPANFYWAPTSTSVVYPNQSLWTLEHEACHAHQHVTINRELGVEPAMPYDLHEWLSTSEAGTWASMVTTAWPATGQWANEPGAHNSVEDFGISCGLYRSDPQLLQQIDPSRYAAMVAILG